MLKGKMCVILSFQDPVFSNGRITRFEINIQDPKDKVKNGSRECESIPVNRSEADSSSSERKITVLKQIQLADEKSVKVSVTAINAVGKSAEALLIIPEKGQGRCSWGLRATGHTLKAMSLNLPYSISRKV